MKIEINLTDEQVKRLFGDNRIRTNGEDHVRRNDEDHILRDDEAHILRDNRNPSGTAVGDLFAADDLVYREGSARAVPQDDRVHDALESCKDSDYAAPQDDRQCDMLVGIYNDLLRVREELLKGRRRAALDQVDVMIDELDNILAEH